MTRYRTQAALIDALNNPRYRSDYRAAIGERAGKIVTRVMPLSAAPHGFADPAGFARSCIYSARRNELFRELCVRLAQKALLRGQLEPSVAA